MCSQCTILVAVLIPALTAQAHGESIRYPNGEPTELPVYSQHINHREERGPMLAILHKVGIPFLADPDDARSAFTVDGKRKQTQLVESAKGQPTWQALFVADRYRRGEDQYLLLAEADPRDRKINKFHGWLADSDCLEAPGMPGAEFVAATDEETLIHQKCLLLGGTCDSWSEAKPR